MSVSYFCKNIFDRLVFYCKKYEFDFIGSKDNDSNKKMGKHNCNLL